MVEIQSNSNETLLEDRMPRRGKSETQYQWESTVRKSPPRKSTWGARSVRRDIMVGFFSGYMANIDLSYGYLSPT